MKINQNGSIRRDLGRLFQGQSVVGLSEAQLLDRFVERRDGLAFEALVARHGPMVLGVCRRLLVDPSDVEDAFQATFLVFVRRAGSIRGRDRLAPWLFGVARKVASRTRADVTRRRSREVNGVEELATSMHSPDRELNQALLEEIDRLPTSLRMPILLCYVDGLSYTEAAIRMESTEPAVRGRLARARERLRNRLTRRGFSPAMLGSGGLLADRAVRVAVPARLLMMTTQLSQAGTFPAGIVILAEGVIPTMIVSKSKVLAAVLLACGVAASGVGVYAQKQGTDKPVQDSAAAAIPAAARTPSPSPDLDRSTDDSEDLKFVQRSVERPQAQEVVTEISTDGGKTWTRQSVTEPTTPGSIIRRADVVTEDVEGVEPPPVAQSPESKRLGQLEKKLDRLIEVLEGSYQPTRARPDQVNLHPQAQPAQVPPPVPPQATPGEIDPLTGRPVGFLLPPGPTRSAKAAPPSAASRPQAPRFPEDATLESRVTFLEANIKHLNARIANLERKLSQTPVILEENADGTVVPYNPQEPRRLEPLLTPQPGPGGHGEIAPVAQPPQPPQPPRPPAISQPASTPTPSPVPTPG